MLEVLHYKATTYNKNIASTNWTVDISVALHVAGGLSVKASASAGFVLGLMFVVTSWALQRF